MELQKINSIKISQKKLVEYITKRINELKEFCITPYPNHPNAKVFDGMKEFIKSDNSSIDFKILDKKLRIEAICSPQMKTAILRTYLVKINHMNYPNEILEPLNIDVKLDDLGNIQIQSDGTLNTIDSLDFDYLVRLMDLLYPSEAK